MKPKFQPGDRVVVTQILFGVGSFRELIGSEYHIREIHSWDPVKQTHTYHLKERMGEVWLEDELDFAEQEDELIVPSAASLAGLFG